MTMTFEQVVETIRQFPPNQREILADLMSRWEIEAVRHEIARDAQDSLAAFRKGELKPRSARDVLTELREYVNEQK